MIIKILLLNIAFFIVNYLIGHVLFSLKKDLADNQNSYLLVLKKIILGLIVFVLIFSVIVTRGLTINTVFITIGILFLFTPKKQYQILNTTEFSFKIELYSLLKLIFSLLFFTFLMLFIFQYFNKSVVSASISPDHYYYSYYGSKMQTYGIEGTDFNLNTSKINASQYMVPYHYFDLWMVCIFNYFSFFKIPLLQTYSFCLTPFVLSLCWLSFISIFTLFKTKPSIIDHFIILVLTLHIAPAEYNFFSGLNLINSAKLYSSVIISAIGFHYFYNKQVTKGFIILSIIGIMNILALPVICISGGLVSLYLIFKKQKKEGIYLFLCLLIIGLHALIFYFVFGKSDNKILTDDFNVMSYVLGGLGYGLKILLRLITAITPIIILLFVFRNSFLDFYKKNKFIIQISGLIILISYFLSIILWNVSDAKQIRSFPGNVMIGILILCSIGLISNEMEKSKSWTKEKIAYVFIAGFYAFCFAGIIKQSRSNAADTLFSKAFIQEIDSYIVPQTTYGYIYNQNRCKTSLWSNNPNLIMSNLNFLGLIPKEMTKVCLSAILNNDSIPKDFKVMEKLIVKGDFRTFADSKGLSNQSVDIAQSAFIKQNNVRYLITTKESDLPLELGSLIEKKIMDPISGSCFFVLK